MERNVERPTEGINTDRANQHAQGLNIVRVLQPLGRQLFVPLLAQTARISRDAVSHLKHDFGHKAGRVMQALNGRRGEGCFARGAQLTGVGFAHLGGYGNPFGTCPPGARLGQFLPNRRMRELDIRSDWNWSMGVRGFHDKLSFTPRPCM